MRHQLVFGFGPVKMFCYPQRNAMKLINLKHCVTLLCAVTSLLQIELVSGLPHFENDLNALRSNNKIIGCARFHKKVTEISEAMDKRNLEFLPNYDKDKFSNLTSAHLDRVSQFVREVFDKDSLPSTTPNPHISMSDKNPESLKRVKRQILPEEIRGSTVTISCNNERTARQLRTRCVRNQPYRTIDGTCNNLQNPLWGSSNTALIRYLAPAYADGLGIPRGGFINDDNEVFSGNNNCEKPDYSKPLPNPRVISTRFHTKSIQDSPRITHMVTQFGQFLDHDLTFAPEFALAHDCCDRRRSLNSPECMPIHVPVDDPFFRFTSTECINFSRSSAFCLSPNKPREQMNSLTSFLDCSHTYGSTDSEHRSLRRFIDGLLRTSFRPNSARELLPVNSGIFQGGDLRATEMPGLAAMHTLFVREHNKIARQLKLRLGNRVSDEDLFQRSRRIMIAEWQNIVYSEYLPVIIGRRRMRMSKVRLPRNQKSRTTYDTKMNPSIRNSFGTAVFRYGHSQIQGSVHMISTKNGRFTNQTYHLRNNFFVMDKYTENDGQGMEDILKGLTMQAAAKRDRFISEEVTNFLFPGIDLVARNIQRGREHGLPGYNDFRQFCGMKRVCAWTNKPQEMSIANWNLLSQIYDHPNDVDIYSAGIAEENYMGGILGRTFSCIFERTFKSLKDGDRYFFTHRGQVNPFSDSQLENLRRRTLRDIICENSGIEELQENVFLRSRRMRSCRLTNSLNFDLFV